MDWWGTNTRVNRVLGVSINKESILSVPIFDLNTCTHEELVRYLCSKYFYIRTQTRFAVRPEDEDTTLFYVDEEDPDNSTQEQLKYESRYGLTATELAEMYHRHKPNNEFYFTWCSLPDMELVYKLLYQHIMLMSRKDNMSLRGIDEKTQEELSILDEFVRFLHPRVSYRIQQEFDKEKLDTLRLPKPKNQNPFKRPSRYQVGQRGERIEKKREVKDDVAPSRVDEYQSPIKPTTSSDSFSNRINRWRSK